MAVILRKLRSHSVYWATEVMILVITAGDLGNLRANCFWMHIEKHVIWGKSQPHGYQRVSFVQLDSSDIKHQRRVW